MYKPRYRPLYFLIVIIVICIGLISRTSWSPAWIYPYLGDVLYATMAYFGFAFLLPRSDPFKLLFLAIAFCFIIEFLQLVDTGWMVRLRSNKYARLVLGQGFLYADLFCYIGGAGLGYFIEKYLMLKK